MGNHKATKAEIEAELKLLKRQQTGSDVASIINNAIRWGGLVLITYFVYRSIDCLAGQTTTASIGLRLLGDIRLSDVFGGLFGLGGIGYGASQRKLRRDTVERLANRIKDLESQIDSKRSSSGLTSRGDTHPKDA